MFMRSIFKLAPLFLIASSAFATNKVGNGGNGVFCKSADKKIESAKLLDFYEKNLDFKTTLTNPMDIAAQQFARLKTMAPKISAQYIHRLNEISNEIDYKENIVLTTIPDSNHLFVPEGCEVIQIAIRQTDVLPGEKRFIFRKDLWQKLSPVDQAGLLTHEIIYEHLSKLGETDSVKARKINRYLYQDDKRENFWKLIQELKIPLYP